MDGETFAYEFLKQQSKLVFTKPTKEGCVEVFATPNYEIAPTPSMTAVVTKDGKREYFIRKNGDAEALLKIIEDIRRGTLEKPEKEK